MNKVIMIGRLANDPEMRTTQSGLSNCNFRIAVNRNFKNANGVYEADFINCVAWRQNADFIHKYFAKGAMIAIEGSLQTRSYDAQDGTKRYVTEVIVDHAEFCGAKQNGGENAQNAPQNFPQRTFEEVPPEEYGELPF